jgi:hypothetical protein
MLLRPKNNIYINMAQLRVKQIYDFVSSVDGAIAANQVSVDAAIAAVQSDVDANETAANNAIADVQSDIEDVQSDVDANAVAIALNTLKETNVSTNLGITKSATTNVITSSDGTDATITAATTTNAGLMTKAIFDEHVANTAKVGITTDQSSAIVANTAKVTNVSTNLGITKSATTNVITSSDGTDATITAATTTNAGLMTKAIFDEHVANTAKVGITTDQSSAIVANTSGIAAQTGRIDALLLDSDGALNTFLEISTFITALSTADVSLLDAISTAVSNDAVHATDISANASGISSLTVRVNTLEALDVVQSVGTAVNKTTFTIPNAVAVGDGNIVVFINGLQIHEVFGEGDLVEGYTTNGTTFTLVNLGYNIDETDHIIVLGVLA